MQRRKDELSFNWTDYICPISEEFRVGENYVNLSKFGVCIDAMEWRDETAESFIIKILNE